MPFPVSCPACGKSFSIADDAYEQKIKGRVVSVKCKQCQGLIRVDGTRPLDAARRPSNAPVDPPPAFLVDTPGATDRELDANQIALEIREGRMTQATLVWREGMGEWTEASKVPELEPFLRAQLSAPAPAEIVASEPARPARIRPMQPTLPMGMMAPPSLAARGVTLPLNPPLGGRPAAPPPSAAPAESAASAADDGFDSLFGPSTETGDVVTSVAPLPPEPARQPARGSAPRVGSSPRAASSPMTAQAPGSAPRPPSAPRAAGPLPTAVSAPRASALPLPTPLPRPAAPPPVSPIPDVDRPSYEPQPYMAPSAFPAQATAPLPPTHPLQSAYPVASTFSGNPTRVGSAFPTAPAPPGTMPEQSISPGQPGPLPASMAPALPGMLPQSLSPAPRTHAVPLPDSFPAAAPIEDLEFRSNRGKGLYVALGLAVIAVLGVIVAVTSGESPKPVPVPTATATAEPAAPATTPSPTATPSPTSESPTGASNPLNPPGSPASPGLPGSPPRTGSEFTDLFAAGAKKLETGKSTPSAAPAPPPSPLTPP